jgi:hypothetical protein
MYFLKIVLSLADYDCIVGLSSIAIQNLKSEQFSVVIVIKAQIFILSFYLFIFFYAFSLYV